MAIMNAAARTFLTEGFERANMDEIAKLADVSKRTIYSHYVSKEGLFEAVVAAMVSRVQKVGEVEWDGRRSIKEQIVEITQSKVDLFGDRNFAGLAKMVMGVFVAQPELAKHTMQALRQCDNGIVNWIRAAQADGALAGVDAVEADQLFGSLLMSTLLWPMINGQSIDPATREARAVAIAQMFAGHLAALA